MTGRQLCVGADAKLAFVISSLHAVSFNCDTGPRDIIRNGIDGILVPQGGAQRLTELRRPMVDDDARARLAERATEIRSRFSIEIIASQGESLFREAVRGPS